MDHMMPEMDGIEAVRIIRNEIGSEYARTVPIIALTANAILGNEEIFLKSGFQAFLTKPIDIVNLNEAVNRWIRDKDLERELRQARGLPDTAPGMAPEAQAESPLTSFLRKEAPAELNISKILERFGSGENWLDSVRTYVASTPEMLASINEAAARMATAILAGQTDKKDLVDYRITVHGIKGSSRAIGVDETGRLAEELEKAAKEGDLDFIRSHSEAFVENAENLIARLRSLLETTDKLFSRPKKPAPDREVLTRLFEAAGAFNISEADKAMEELEKYEYETQEDLIPWLREQVGLSEFEQIQERLSNQFFIGV
jgi:CheY-like chemotaxis protein